MNKIRAFIDLGTNTFHLLIAAISEGEAEIIFRTREIVGLGAGGINKGLIMADAFQRGEKCLDEFKSICATYGVEQINAYGTSALRNASNSHAFIERVLENTGIRIEVINGDREAELIQLGISASLHKIDTPYLIMDIGGGSTEFILVHGDTILKKQSFEVGVQRLLSAYFTDDPLPPAEYERLMSHLDDFLAVLDEFKALKPKVLVGASGTFTTLLRMFNTAYGGTESTATEVKATFFRDVFDRFLTLPRADRLKLPGMSAPRVDLIVVGSCLVHFVLNTFAFDGFFVSGNGLKEGAMVLASKGKI